MDNTVEQIRRNLVEASTSLNLISPRSPEWLQHEISEAWRRYYQIAQREELNRTRPGKQGDLGFILPFVIAGVVGLAALMGGSAYIAYELGESDRLKKLAKCIEEATKSGISYDRAQRSCNELYGKQKAPLVSVGGLNVTTIAIVGGLGLAGFFLLGKFLK